MLPDGYLHLTECPELTIDYLEGGLPRRALRAVEAHLETCADCRKAVAEQKRIATLMQSQEQVNPPHALKSRVMAGLTAETAAGKERYAAHARLWARLRSAWKVQTLLAAVVALLFASVAPVACGSHPLRRGHCLLCPFPHARLSSCHRIKSDRHSRGGRSGGQRR